MKALIVDDEPHVIAVAKLLVDWEKYQIDQVFTCVDSLKALELIRTERPAVILSDIRMPGLDGLSLIAQVKEIDPAIRTILISAYSDFSYAQKAVGLGCVDYLLKPLTEEGLNQAVARAVSQYRAERARAVQPLLSQAQSLLFRYLNSGHSASVFEELTEAAPFFSQLEKCRIGILSLRELPLKAADRHRLSASLHEFFYHRRLGAATPWNDSKDILIFLLADDRTAAACEEIFLRLENEYEVPLPYGLSAAVSFPDEWEAAYIAAQKAANAVTGNDTLPQIHQYILDRYADLLSLDFLAELFSLSPAYLSRSFKKRYEIGLTDFITQVRIEKAKLLIQNSPLLLSDIAASVGIPDPKYFSRVFKRVAGCSPAEFRARGGIEK